MLSYEEHIPANKPRSALTTAAEATYLIDLSRFQNFCKLYFRNGAQRLISVDYSLFSLNLSQSALLFLSAASAREYVICYAIGCHVMLMSGSMEFGGFEIIDAALNCLCIMFIVLHSVFMSTVVYSIGRC